MPMGASLFEIVCGTFNKFPTFLYRHLKLSETLEKSVCYCYTSYEMTDQFLWFQVQSTATAAIGIHPIKPDCNSWWISKMQSGREDTLEEWYAIKFCFNLEKMPQNVWNASDFFQPSCMNRASEHQSWLAKRLGLGLLCWGFKEFRKRFRQKRPALFKSDQWYFHQDNAPVHNSILVTDYLTKMASRQFLAVPIVQTCSLRLLLIP